MHKIYFISIALLLSLTATSQEENPVDTTRVDTLSEVTVTGFELGRRAFTSSFAVKNLRLENADRNNKISLVNGFNTVAGVRMEERSPGSYRLNIRGSSLRSPFGVRNVKVYWNGIPVTDPGGNTYFNQFALNNFSSIEVFKGPAGSLYGAGTGGLILMQSFENSWKPGLSAEYMAGSYGLQNVFVTAKTGGHDNRSQVSYAHNEQDGYRVQSAMRRDNLSWSVLYNISAKQQLSAHVLFTDMYYQTPGGLTKTEFEKDPKAARPAAGGLPSAVQARAAIYQKNILAGIQNRYKIDSHFTNTTSLYVAYAQIKNPAVRNFERRSEPHAGGRTSFAWEKTKAQSTIKLVAGAELQEGFFDTKVFQNRQGVSDTLQTDDETRFHTYSLFAQADLSIGNWFVTAGTSINRNKVEITRLNKYPVRTQNRTYKTEWAPRLSILRKLQENTSVFAIVSKGFSPPTIAELLPSTGNISTFLEAESGIDYEAGIRQRFFGEHLDMELNAYYFKLNNTLVQRRDNSGGDFFVNAGDTRQKGIEWSADYVKSFHASSILENIWLNASYAYSHYRYGDFSKDTVDFSGKTLPSVPAHTFSFLIDTKFDHGIYSNISFYHASKIFLNDANTTSAQAYDLLGWRLGWQKKFNNRSALNIYFGADNLLDEVYSLGNDINDARGRYYNTAPRRSYYFGLVFQFFSGGRERGLL